MQYTRTPNYSYLGHAEGDEKKKERGGEGEELSVTSVVSSENNKSLISPSTIWLRFCNRVRNVHPELLTTNPFTF